MVPATLLPDGQTAFKILDLKPQQYRNKKTGALLGAARSILEKGPVAWFFENDLYTVRATGQANDDIEKHLIGRIDREGQLGLDALVKEDFDTLHDYYDRFFEFMDALRLRTPKGLLFVQQIAGAQGHYNLLMRMQQLRTMHCVMWGESAREIFSAADSKVKFLFSDHPVTFYNRHVFPADPRISSGMDPPQQWMGTQTLFPLDRNRLAVLTHAEWARNPVKKLACRSRTNARMFDNTMIWYHDWERKRSLTEDQVQAVNYVIKLRAHRYIAAASESDLYPERHLKIRMWDKLCPFLMPSGLATAEQSGYTVLGMNDGSFYFQDEFGRRPRTKAEHEAEVVRAKAMQERIEEILRRHHAKKAAGGGDEDPRTEP